jgi:transposase-like protein
MACWLFATQKDGISALSLKRSLEIGSYQTAWAMLHRLRSVLVRPGRERLRGKVEVDETYIGGEEPGLAGGRQKGKKVSSASPSSESSRRDSGAAGWPHCPISGDSLRSFLLENVQEGATVITDGWKAYPPATRDLYVHEPLPGAIRADAHRLLPGMHKVSSLAKRWLLGTHQGSVDEAHLPGYLNEFVFRFNRHRSRSRGLVFYRVLELTATHDPVRYRELIANPRPGHTPGQPPPATRAKAASLDRPPANRPWRAATPLYSG